MQKYQLSFAKINVLTEHIAEVIVGQDVVISLEMSEEYDDFLTNIFSNNFTSGKVKYNSRIFSSICRYCKRVTYNFTTKTF